MPSSQHPLEEKTNSTQHLVENHQYLIDFFFRLGGFHILDMILRKGACCWGAFGWLHVQLEHGHLMYGAIHSEFAHRYSYKSHTVPSCSGKKKVRVMEKLLESVSSPLVCFPQLLTPLSYATILSPLPFLGKNLSPKVYVEVVSLRMWHGKKCVTF